MPTIKDENKTVVDLLTGIKDETANRDVLKEISESLKDIASDSEKSTKMAAEEKTQKLKEKTTNETPTPATPAPQESEAEKDLSFLRQTFEETFAGLKDVLSPGGLLKSFGLFSGSPVFMLLGDKLDSLIDSYQDYREEKKTRDDEMLAQAKESNQNAFLDEQIQDEQMAAREKTNELLQEIVDKPFEVKEDKKGGLLEMLKAPLAMFQKVLPQSLVKAFGSGAMGKVFSKVFGGVGKLPGLKGMGGLLKGGGKLLGKLALPLAIATSGIDFFSGFQNAFEITGRDDLSAKIQAGLSEAISGFTFGLVDPKTISKTIDMVNDKLAQIFWDSVDYIKDAFSGKVDVLGDLSSVLSNLSFGLFTKEDVEGAVKALGEKILNFFRSPLTLVENIFSGKDLLGSINQYISDITFGIITEENVVAVYDFFVDKIKKIFTDPFGLIKEIFNPDKIMNFLRGALDVITFGMFTPEEIDNMLNIAITKIKDILTTPFNLLKSMWENGKQLVLDEFAKVAEMAQPIIDSITGIFDTISESISNLIERITEVFVNRYEDLKSKITNIKDIITSPLDALKNRLFGEDEEAPTAPQVYRGKVPKVEPTNTQTFDKTADVVNTIKKENIIIKKISELKNKSYQEILDDIYKRKDAAAKPANNTVLSNQVNNNIIPQEDMSTKNDDPNWNQFMLNF